MDLVCTRCGEPWHMDHVLHEDPEGFERTGGVILRCPSCPKYLPELSARERKRLMEIRAIGEQLGDDIDGFTAALEDFDLL